MNSDTTNQEPRKEPVPAPQPHVLAGKNAFGSVQKVTAWVMIISAILFALVGILAIWEVFGENAGDTIGRAFGSLVIVAFAALIVNVASRIGEGKH